MAKREINVTINGAAVAAEVEERMLLVYFLREVQNLTGTHIGCETGHCGACTVDLDGQWSSPAWCSRSRPTAASC